MATKKKAKGPVLVVQAKVKEAIKKNKMNCASDVMPALTELMNWHLKQACTRAKSNGRKTVRGTDL